MPDFAKCFFVRYAQIYEAYVERTLIKFVYSWRKNSRKSGCKGDSESTSIIKGGFHMQTLTSKKWITTRDLVYCSIFTVLIAVGAFIKIPIPVVPFTLQFLFTTMAGLILGSKRGAISVVIYTLLGLFGLPIFSQGGGIYYVLVPSFGYIIGFIFGTYITGKIIEIINKRTLLTYLIANFSGLLIVYLVGMVYYYVLSNYTTPLHIWLYTDVAKYYYVLSNYTTPSPIGLWSLFLYCFVLAVPGDIFICIFTAILAVRLNPLLEEFKN